MLHPVTYFLVLGKQDIMLLTQVWLYHQHHWHSQSGARGYKGPKYHARRGVEIIFKTNLCPSQPEEESSAPHCFQTASWYTVTSWMANWHNRQKIS